MPTVEFVSHIDHVKGATNQVLERAAEIIGGMAESFAKESCPVDTGNLRNSINHQSVSEERGVTIIVGSAVTYAPYVELGTGKYAKGGRQTPWRYQDHNGNWHTTSGMSARPYLRPAVENHINDYREVLQSELSKAT